MGRPRAARAVPRGSRWPRPSTSATSPATAMGTASRSSRWPAYCSPATPTPDSSAHQRRCGSGCAPGAGRRGGAAPAARAPGPRDQRQDAEEDQPPGGHRGQQAGQQRTDQRGHHPRRRERPEQRRAHAGVEGRPGHHVDRHRDEAAAQALHGAAQDEQRHVHGQAGGHQPGREDADAPQQRHPGHAGPRGRRRAPCPRPGDQEGGERPAVPGQAVQLGDRGGQHGGHRHGLERHEGDQGDQPGGRQPVPAVEDAAHSSGNPPVAAPLPGRSARTASIVSASAGPLSGR